MNLVKPMSAAVLALSLIACDRGTIDSNLIASGADGNNNIHRSYTVDFHETQASSMATAQFSVGGSYGTTVRLIAPASVRINGVTPKESTDRMDGGELGAFYLGFLFPPAWLFTAATGTIYHQQLAATAGSVMFEFVDNHGNRFVDSVQAPRVGLIVPSAVASQDGIPVQVSGGASGARITVKLSQGHTRRSISSSSAYVLVSRTDLAEFQPGHIELEVEVRSTQSLPTLGKSLGGSASTSYTFSKRTVRVW